MRLREVVLALVVAMGSAGAAHAQKIEVSGLLGWTYSDGVEGDPIAVGGQEFDGVAAGDVRYTPTCIRSTTEGWWCDTYGGCDVVTDAKFANQFTFNGGVTIRF